MNNMNLQEQINRIHSMMGTINELDNKKDLTNIIENLLNTTLVEVNENVCKVRVIHPDNREGNQHYAVIIYVIGGYRDYDKIINDAWNDVWDFLNTPIDVYTWKTSSCDEKDEDHMLVQENNRPNIIKNMVNDFGLYDAIKMVGTSDEVLKHINPEDISDENKIKFINEFTKKMAHNYGRERNFTVFDIGISPVMYDKVGNTERTINSFHVNGVNATVYKNDRYDTGYAMLYSHMPTEKLDKIFKLMLELSDNL
jgi:hypothetical protein